MSWCLWHCRNKREEMKPSVFIRFGELGKCAIWFLVILFHLLLFFLGSLLFLFFGFNLPSLGCILDSWIFTLSDSQQRALLCSVVWEINFLPLAFSVLTATRDTLELRYLSSFLSFWFIYTDHDRFLEPISLRI